MTNHELIEKFYTAFNHKDAEQMLSCYHDNIVFEDPAFGILNGERAKGMWQMLISRGENIESIKFYDVEANEQTGKAKWIAKYKFGPKKRAVVNHISATFEFADGKIIKHTDTFDLWKWSSQALGLPGQLLGWSGFMKKKIRSTSNRALSRFLEKQ